MSASFHMIFGAIAVQLVMISPALAQDEDEALEQIERSASRKPVQTIEARGAVELRNAMRRIAQQPSDVDALVDAGNASLLLGDAEAALNFFTRAHNVQPGNGRIKAGLAIATVRNENPFEALRLFDDAVKLGVSERSIAADRAVAFDLLGNFDRAQQDYRLARTAAIPDNLVINQSVSLSLSGRSGDADALIAPLLRQNNAEAWRARAFMLAARGDLKQAVQVAQAFLDPQAAGQMERFLRLMPQLTGAQQAAAIHLGHFPTRDFGRDSDEIRRLAVNTANVARPASDSRLIPAGDPLGKPSAKNDADKNASTRKNAGRDKKRKEEKAADNRSSNTAPVTGKGAGGTRLAQVQESQKAPPATAAGNDALRGIEIPQRQVTASAPVYGPPAPDSGSQTPAFDLGAVVSGIEIPAEEKQNDVVAVDLKKVEALRRAEQEKAEKAARAEAEKLAAAKAAEEKAKKAKAEKAKLDKNPARIWAQVATGKVSALAFDYRRLTRKHPELFKSVEGWSSLWGGAGRLVVGPFKDDGAARKWIADYRKAGGDSFLWKSDDGTIVDKLPVK